MTSAPLFDLMSSKIIEFFQKPVMWLWYGSDGNFYFVVDIDLDFNFPPRLPLGYGLDEYDVDNELYDGDEPITLYAYVPVATWSIKDVIHFVR